jgi:hypothetical protein
MSGTSWFDQFSLVKQRQTGALDPLDPASYKRFKGMPKTSETHILYRGDTRSPDMVKQVKGFFPQSGKSNVSPSGASTAMVCLTLNPSVGATYYSVRKYFNTKMENFGPGSDMRGYVYAVLLPTGRGILNYEMAATVGSKNLGSQEISTLCVPWDNVIGWRKLLTQDECKCNKPEYHFVNWYEPFVANTDFSGGSVVIGQDDKETFSEYMTADDLLIWNSKYL